jgi:hypothetical protein
MNDILTRRIILVRIVNIQAFQHNRRMLIIINVAYANECSNIVDYIVK